MNGVNASRDPLWIRVGITDGEGILSAMQIEIIGDDSINRQARTYAEYRLFAFLSRVLDTGRVNNASLQLRRAKNRRHCDRVGCVVTVELLGGEVIRLRTYGDHPYAAINRAVERLALRPWPGRQMHAADSRSPTTEVRGPTPTVVPPLTVSG